MTSRPSAPSPLSQNALHEAALAYLTHRSSSVAQMRKVLARRIATWARRAGESDDVATEVERAREAAAAVIARLLSSGLLNDAAYAQNRAQALTRAGKSRRAVAFELARKGVGDDAARAAIPSDPETELAAAVALMRKKRLGTFARVEPIDEKTRKKWLGAFARAGFSFATAQRALRMNREAADELLRQLR